MSHFFSSVEDFRRDSPDGSFTSEPCPVCPQCGRGYGRIERVFVDSSLKDWKRIEAVRIYIEGECGHGWQFTLGEHAGLLFVAGSCSMPECGIRPSAQHSRRRPTIKSQTPRV